MHALIEGLAGVRDLDTGYRSVELSPRWMAGGVDEVAATARYAASSGYVTYRFRHDAANHSIAVTATGSAAHCRLRILLPAHATGVSELLVDGALRPAEVEHVRDSVYAAIEVPLMKPVRIEVRYRD